MIKKLALFVLAGLLVLTGCSRASSTASSAVTSGGTASSAAPRVVKDAGGKDVTVPFRPSRVVVTHNAGTQALLDLGLTPIGRGPVNETDVPESHWAKIKDVPIIADNSDAGAPKIEDIAGLHPDVIVVPNTIKDDVLEQLGKIAPVYRFTLRGGSRANWQQRVQEMATLTNRQAEFDAAKKAYETRQQTIKTTYADKIKDKKVAVVASFEKNNFYAWGEKNMTGSIIAPLGFQWSAQENAAVAGQKEPEATLSMEKLPDTVGDADIIFHDSTERAQTRPLFQAVMETDLWKNLPAVKAGHYYPVGKTTVAGFAEANYVLDRVEDALKKL